MDNQISIELIREKYQALGSVLDEHSRRLWAATEAKAIGHGGLVTSDDLCRFTRT
jgi:hypothetical protein